MAVYNKSGTALTALYNKGGTELDYGYDKSGNVIYTRALYYWDFTKSATDTIQNMALTLSGCSITSNGLYLNARASNAPIGINMSGRTAIFEIGSISKGYTNSYNGRFITLNSSASDTSWSRGFMFRSNGYWSTYFGSWTNGASTAADYLANKTLKMVFDSTNVTIYVDDTQYLKVAHNGYTYINIGCTSSSNNYSTSTAFYNSYIKSLKILEN